MPSRTPATIESLESRTLLASIAVNINQTAQTMSGLGGNYARGRFGDFYIPSNDGVGTYTLDHLNPKHARIGIPLRGWEATNDDSDPNSMNMAGFATSNAAVNNVFLLMQDLHNRGIAITGTIWDAPGWMVSNPTSTNGRLIPAANYGEFIESIAAFLKRAQDVYGVTIDYLSLNEPSAGYNIKWRSFEETALIAQAGPKFAQLGLSYTPKWLVGDTGNALQLGNATSGYAKSIMSDSAAAPYLGPISFHAWDSLTYADSTLTDIAALGKQYNKEIWCEELGYDANAWTNSSTFLTWDYAFKTAQTYYKVIKLAGASVVDYWELQDDYPVLKSSPLTLYPSYYVISQLHQNFTPGTQMVGATSDTSSILSMAGSNPTTGRVAVEAINTGASSQTVTINGLPAGIVMNLVRSSGTENGASIGSFTATNGSITVTLPAASVSTLWGIRATARPTVRGVPLSAPLPAAPAASAPLSLAAEPALSTARVSSLSAQPAVAIVDSTARATTPNPASDIYSRPIFSPIIRSRLSSTVIAWIDAILARLKQPNRPA